MKQDTPTPDLAIDRLKRALERKPDATRVNINRSTVEALIAAADGRQIITLGDAARLIFAQRYGAVQDALSAADGREGEEAVASFLSVLSASDDEITISESTQ